MVFPGTTTSMAASPSFPSSMTRCRSPSKCSNVWTRPEGQRIVRPSTCAVAQAEVHNARGLRAEAVDGVEFAHELLAANSRREPRPDAQAVALRAAERDVQVVLVGELVLEEEQRPAADLPHDAGRAGHCSGSRRRRPTAVAVAVGAGQMQLMSSEVAPLDVEEGAVPLVGAEVVALRDDVPGVARPRTRRGLGRACPGSANLGAAVEWL